ncbi:iron-sulfur cluster assembly protein HesB [Skermanella stibiiresistens SB22]|uniref:Iron-sulfur cluster assembly protein HesB n=1 Tax=Skermanella stibiiresistens SB22 TaxID=1385369 RepID=W9H5M9_9PROT|nr:SIS domain-containing protein [Skermanella stibiiresistens]EWY39063.1 iron-sulfur cluster assembly protein HesB [Skermanella stibiiresistens SB22]
MTETVGELASQACAEIARTFETIDGSQVDALVEALAAARRIVLHGVGREGLMMRALTMRLFHMGLEAHPVGDMTTPAIGAGDLLVVSAGPGGFSTIMALIGVAREAGAKVAVITAQPAGGAARTADLVMFLPAQTMANDSGAAASAVLSMGSAFEGAQYVFFEVLVLLLRQRLGISAEDMRARHTNLE